MQPQTVVVPIGSIKPNPTNPRLIRDDRFKKLVASIVAFPQMLTLRPIVVNRDGVVLGGNMRLKACVEAKLKEVPVIYADTLTPEQEREFIIKDNVGFGEWEWETLANEWDVDQLEEWGLDVPDFDKEPSDGLTDPDEVPEAPETPISVPGDLWILGDHRLLCGDSTSATAIDTLMNGAKADMLFTDPPWNVNYGAVKKANAQGYKPRTILNDHMDDQAWSEFVGGFCGSFAIATKDGAPVYVVMSAQEWPSIHAGLSAAGFHWSSTIVWVKDRLVLSRKDYHTQYEPIWYGWNEKAARLVAVEDRKQSDVWQIPRPSVSDLHPTTKPIELVERAIANSSKPGDLVLDLFGGSGSTLIACERTGRQNCSMELDPKYVDVIVKRWQDFTGRDAINSNTGQSFNDLTSNNGRTANG